MISAVMEAALRSFALGLVLWLILAITRPSNPHLHKLVWSAALGAALAMPLLMRAPVVPTLHAPDYVLSLQAVKGGATYSNAAWSGVGALYILVALTLLGRYCVSLLRMWRIRRNARRIAPWSIAALEITTLDVRVSPQLRSPATFGVTILLPPDFVEWSHRKIAAVLAHERSHVIHRDCYVLWLARLHVCIFWFNPFAWWLQQRLAALAEAISDEAAVQAVNDTSAYAEILLEFATHRPVSAVATAMARPAIARRIERIISGITPSATPRLSQRMLVIAALLPVMAAATVPLERAPLHLAQNITPTSDPTSQQPSLKTGVIPPELWKYYPKEAARKGINGLVQIQVSLDAKGRATDTLILSEDPQDLGFGAAASTLAHLMEYGNPTGRPAQLSFRVKFELSSSPPPSGTTNFETPDAQ
jgi:beta-lactamase regulating signal transducer with metallopeptidase domain